MELLATVRLNRNEASQKIPFTDTKSQSLSDLSLFGISTSTISPKNVLAFSTSNPVKENNNLNFGRNMSYVYVCDINIPWDCHLIKASLAQVTVLEWDHYGKNLIVADSAGNAEVWTSPTHLLNEWIKVASVCLPDEPIKAVVHFHNGKKIVANIQNRDSSSYLDRYPQIDMKCTLKGFGARPLEGFIAVGASGLVQGAVIENGKVLTTNVDVLGGFRLAYKFVDLAWTKEGDILAIASTGLSVDPIVHCKLRIVKGGANELNSVSSGYALQSEALTGLFPNSSQDINAVVNGLSFNTCEEPSGIFILLNTPTSGKLEYWELAELERPVHSLFSTAQATTRYQSWQCLSSFLWGTSIALICPSKKTWINSSDVANNLQNPMIIATADGDLVYLNKSLKQVAHLPLKEKLHPDSKASVTSLCFTSTAHALVAFDSLSTMSIFKLLPSTDSGGSVPMSYALMALEYCLVTGIDHWDILLGLRSTMLEPLSERLTEGFHQQSPGLQQLLQQRLICIKLSMLRMVPNNTAKAGLQYGILMVNAIYSSLKSLLRPPPELYNSDRAATDCLAAVLANKSAEIGTEVDKVFPHLEVKEFTVEASTLITIQHLIQWIVSFILKLVTSLPEWRNAPRGTMCDMLRDPKLLGVLREMLVIFRIWGLIRTSCLPTFSHMEEVDVIATLFRILTRLSQCPEPDESIIDECFQLSSQLIVPDIGLPFAARGLASPSIYYQLPLQYEFDVSPDDATTRHETPDSEIKMDSIRHVYLGNKPHNLRYCTRCKGLSVIVKGLRVSRSAAAKSWDMRWQTLCPCKGFWVRQESS